VDHLVARKVRCVTVLDISAAALRRAQERLPGATVEWIQADVTGDWSACPADLWHDRAVFHFLTDAADRRRYVERLTRTLKPRGQAVIATFAADGPATCSGLPVLRYSAESLAAELGSAFRLVESAREVHRTPSGATQAFSYGRFVRD
jgi:trans-aconitate methyltransferase